MFAAPLGSNSWTSRVVPFRIPIPGESPGVFLAFFWRKSRKKLPDSQWNLKHMCFSTFQGRTYVWHMLWLECAHVVNNSVYIYMFLARLPLLHTCSCVLFLHIMFVSCVYKLLIHTCVVYLLFASCTRFYIIVCVQPIITNRIQLMLGALLTNMQVRPCYKVWTVNFRFVDETVRSACCFFSPTHFLKSVFT